MESLRSHMLFKKYKKVDMLCRPLYQLGISGFIYMRRYPDGKFIDLANQVEWASFFLEKFLNAEYPIGITEDHMLSEKGVLLWNMEPDNLVWQEGEQIFGFGNGISIYKQRPQYCEIFCFYGKKEDYYLNKLFIQSFFLLEKFFSYFTQNMAADIYTAHERNDLLVVPKVYLFSEWKIISQKSENKFLQALGASNRLSFLSPREKECIYLCSIGKTAKEIGRDIHLSPRTVETYLASAKRKTNCKNLKDLIYKFAYETEQIFE